MKIRTTVIILYTWGWLYHGDDISIFREIIDRQKWLKFYFTARFIARSSDQKQLPEMVYKEVDFKNFANFTSKYLYKGLFLISCRPA